MFVIKRDGKKESVKFDKVTARIEKLSYSLSPLVDEANDLDIQLIDLFSPVGDIHPVSSRCSDAFSAASLRNDCSLNDKRRFPSTRPAISLSRLMFATPR